MADETDTTSEVARVLELGHAWYEATVAYHRAVEEAFRPLLEMGRARAAQEAQIAASVPAGQPAAGSAGRGGSGGSCARCGAGITLPAGDPENREMAVCMPCEIAVLKEGYRMTRAQVEAIRGQIAYEARHGDAITRCNLVAERFRTVLDGVTKPETNENEEA